MPERFEKILRVACLLFAVVLLFQLARLVVRGDPLKKAKIPALPALAGTTNNQSSITNGPSATNSAALKDGKGTTNNPGLKELAKKGAPGRGRGEPGKAPADLPPLVKDRIERITQSEILGQIVRPM